MATSRRPPPFPQPPPAPTVIPVPNVANGYLSVGPAQGFGRVPQIPSPRTTSSQLPPPYEPFPPQHPPAYLPTSQPIPASVRHHPAAFPTPQIQAQIAHAPTAYLGPPPHGMQRSVTMPVPNLSNGTQVASGPHQSHVLQASTMSHARSNSGMSGETQIKVPANHQRTQDSGNERYSENRDDDTRAKGPPSRPFFSGGSRTSSSSRRQTVEPQVRDSQLPMLPCRYPTCNALIRSDVAARLGGFCGDSHMRRAIYEGIATQCPRCQRVCPKGSIYCSARCATGHS